MSPLGYAGWWEVRGLASNAWNVNFNNGNDTQNNRNNDNAVRLVRSGE
ncbi:hypothetical protein HMY34_07275 [Thiothrix subterranea]|nr:hypothetical protein [Thiothrix subterranea]QQZ28569.1 hypothetical protein HMY34_07275 [Thiothrix subterranea]